MFAFSIRGNNVTLRHHSELGRVSVLTSIFESGGYIFLLLCFTYIV